MLFTTPPDAREAYRHRPAAETSSAGGKFREGHRDGCHAGADRSQPGRLGDQPPESIRQRAGQADRRLTIAAGQDQCETGLAVRRAHCARMIGAAGLRLQQADQALIAVEPELQDQLIRLVELDEKQA